MGFKCPNCKRKLCSVLCRYSNHRLVYVCLHCEHEEKTYFPYLKAFQEGEENGDIDSI